MRFFAALLLAFIAFNAVAADLNGSRQTGTVNLTFDQNFANWTFQSVWIDFEEDAFIIPVVHSPNSTLLRICAGDVRHLSTERVG